MGAMTNERLDTLLAERMEEHAQWNESVVPRSKGARERASTRYDILAGPVSPRRLASLRRLGLREEFLPEQSIHIRLSPSCRKARRKGKTYVQAS
jgi:hypothetical protein